MSFNNNNKLTKTTTTTKKNKQNEGKSLSKADFRNVSQGMTASKERKKKNIIPFSFPLEKRGSGSINDVNVSVSVKKKKMYIYKKFDDISVSVKVYHFILGSFMVDWAQNTS